MRSVNLVSRFALALVLASACASAQETVLYTFTGSSENTMPASGLVMDAEGNLFGTTVGGPENGVVFELSKVGSKWTEHTIYEYAGVNGDDFGPTGNLAIDKSGNLYWSTPLGGIGNCGYVYELVHESGDSWSGKVIHTFAGSPADGCSALAGFVFDSQGNLYGTTSGGGKSSMGTVFELSPKSGGSWSETILWNFTGNFSDGQYPHGTLIFDAAGNLYGTTEGGGIDGAGTVFELKPSGSSWTETVLYSFGTNPHDGIDPQAGLIFDKAGNLYGTTSGGEGNSDGAVFELIPGSGGKWTERILHTFAAGTPDGVQPEGSVVFDAKGNLYGTTRLGGLDATNFPASGIVFQLVPTTSGPWTERILHTFNTPNSDGEEPECNLIFGPDGALYGTTRRGGIFQNGVLPEGTVFEFANPDRTATPSFTPPGGIYSSAQTVHITDASSGASIYYTTNGEVPDSSSTPYTGPFKVTESEMVKAIAYAAGNTPSPVASSPYKFESVAAAPRFSPPAGAYNGAQQVTISDSTPKCVFHFTTDNSKPTSSSPIYSKPIAVGQNVTIKAFCVASGYLAGPVAAAAYSLHLLPAVKPVFTPDGGTFSSTKIVHLTSTTPHAVIFYTTEHTTPLEYWSLCTSAGIKVLQSETIWAVATAYGYSKSPQASAAFTLNLPATADPVFMPAPGSYGQGFFIKASDATPGAVIHYTSYGQRVTIDSPVFPSEGLGFASAVETINLLAWAKGYDPSNAVTGTFTIQKSNVGSPVFSPKPGTYKAAVTVTLTSATSEAAIYYTTDGSYPSASSTLYTSAGIPVRQSETINAIAIAPNKSQSPASVATYVIP